MDEPRDPHSRDARSGNDDPTVRDSIERVDSEIGPYRLLERLGEGAMGEVWRAEQRDPVKRIVALKIIKRGMDTREVVTRFEIERQAMALMDHPWIARVHDAGETNNGRPYIVLEYIAGEKLTDYCARNRLSIEERLKLFQKVCRAIQHAHQKAVIHRDLKPSNILVVEVDGEPVPKIIDFGIAKATAQRLTDRSAATFVGQLIGTPLYMSPEQVEMSAAGVDTRADVYSLGVILYELLSGALPHDPQRLARAAFDEVLKVLREEDPERPSTKISTLGDKTTEIAAQRGLDPKKLAGKLEGDLDWITLKALEKDRKRRYETPRDIADDIERYLRVEAIVARPPSIGYRTSRFVRRHAAGVSIGAVLLLALVGATVWQTIQSGIIAHERDRAMANERLSLAREQLAEDPTASLAYALSSLEILDQSSARDVVRKAIAQGPVRDEWPRHGVRGNPIEVDASPDGNFVAVAWSQSEHPTVGIYDVRTLDMRSLEAPTNSIVYWVAFNADGSLVVATGNDGAHVWRVSDGKHLIHLPPRADVTVSEMFATDDPRQFILATSEHDQPSLLHRFDLVDGSLTELGHTVGRHVRDAESHRAAIDPRQEWILDFQGGDLFLQRFADLDTQRATLVGHHDATITGVALGPDIETAVSIDQTGAVRVWDLREASPTLLREFQQEPGAYHVEFDSSGERFFISWGSDNLSVIDLRATPTQRPTELLDRSFWTHDGTFLPDGSVVTCRNGIRVGPVTRWRNDSPVAWSLDSVGINAPSSALGVTRSDARLIAWLSTGEVVGFPLEDGVEEGIGVLGRTDAWDSGIWHSFFVSPDGRRCVTFTAGNELVKVLDVETGRTRAVAPFASMHLLLAIDESAKSACVIDYEDGEGEDNALRIVDLDSLNVVATVNVGGPAYQSVAFTDREQLVALGSDHILRFDLASPSADPDTLWRGDARRQGVVLDQGRSALVRDRDSRLTWVDLLSGEERSLGSVPRSGLEAAFDPARGMLAVSGWWDFIAVFSLRSGEGWQIPVPKGARYVNWLAFDAMGQSLIAQYLDRIVAWKIPLDPLLGELSHDDLLNAIRARTNVRVTADSSAETGFAITNTAEPGS